MKIAITADIHLKTRTETPESFNALENIFQQMKQKGISILIIAGDLFDKEFANYHDFDSLCREYTYIHIIIIPGNHDPQIEERFFTTSNIKIIRKPLIKEIYGSPFLFVPYDSTKSMDELLAEFWHSNELPERWVLIGHGDYITKNKDLNPYEPGVYMPVSSRTINKFNPSRVILGHIHKQSEFGKVIYPGSPCGLDIRETGKRKFIIFDTQTSSIETVSIETDVIYFTESILMLPVEDETNFLENKINQMIESWGLTNAELKKVKLGFVIKGYTKYLHDFKNTIIDLIGQRGVSFYSPDDPTISELKVLKDIERISVLEKVKQNIDNLPLENFYATKDEILEKAMELIFSE